MLSSPTDLPLDIRLKLIEEENLCLKMKISELQELQKNHSALAEDLVAKEAFNFALFQFTPVLIVVVDRDGKVVKSNKAKQNSGDRLPNIADRMYIDYARHHNIDMRSVLMDCIESQTTKSFPEMKYGTKYLSISISPIPQGAIIATRDITDQKTAELDRLNLITELKRALDEVETLRGLLPICASCKKIRDDQGYWNHIEIYISKRTLADFTHTLCPGCIQNYYPDYWEEHLKNKAPATEKGQERKE